MFDVASALGELSVEVDKLLVDGVDVVDGVEARGLIDELVGLERRVAAFGVEVQQAVQRSGGHYEDGHVSAKVMVRHRGRLSGPESANRERVGRMFADLGSLAHAYRSAEVGTEQVRLLARVWSNSRVRQAMEPRQEWFISLAKRLSYPNFELRVREWERLVDQDGPTPAAEVSHANRNSQLVQNVMDLSWELAGRFGPLDGAANSEIFNAYVTAEWHADWAEATGRVGDGVCEADLARTPAQRRADAMSQIFADAAANPEGSMPAGFLHSIVWSAEAYEEMASRFDGNPPKPFDPDTFECRSGDGAALDPTEAFANSMLNQIRRVVVDARSVTIDLGEARQFRRGARDAVHVNETECFWIGCWVPATECETDHLHPHGDGGRTNPGNGAPACGRHNRWKQKGYRVHRDNHGRIHIWRPDGTEID